MNTEDNSKGHLQNDVSSVVDEIFSGKNSIADALEKLRTRLLDLSGRNALLNYKHPKNRSIQFVGQKNLNLVFERLHTDAKDISIKFVPEPDLDYYEGKKPEARQFAKDFGIDTTIENSATSNSALSQRLSGLQTLYYPAELERQMRKLASEANTAIEETGSNMLFLIFGFLEFFDSDDSDKPMLAPLISLPVSLVKGKIDIETRTFQYSLQHSGEDVAENFTLLEKMRRDFTLSLPELSEEFDPESYFKVIEQAVKSKRRWRVRRQLTLGMLSFGKLAIWAGLNTKKYPGLIEHELIKTIFSGNKNAGSSDLFASDYDIDRHPRGEQSLIYDADSSQHSAIIDALDGKNLVINGPPGTGKSQTITNIVATAMAQGKKVLFVSEKLAALEVVRRRLDAAGLGHFCLELHSHKTQKKKFLEDIDERINAKFTAPSHLSAKLTSLKRQKATLSRYAELMASKIGNKLGLTINEVMWASERRRQALGDMSANINSIILNDAIDWSTDDFSQRNFLISSLAELFALIAKEEQLNQWLGFYPNALAPGDDQEIYNLVERALQQAELANNAAAECIAYFETPVEPSMLAISQVRTKLAKVPAFPSDGDGSLIQRLFNKNDDFNRKQTRLTLDKLYQSVADATVLNTKSQIYLIANFNATETDIEEIKNKATQQNLVDSFLTAKVSKSLLVLQQFQKTIDAFYEQIQIAQTPDTHIPNDVVVEFLSTCAAVSNAGLADHSIKDIFDRASQAQIVLDSLTASVSVIKAIAERRGFQFDTTLESVRKLQQSENVVDLKEKIIVEDALVSRARILAKDEYQNKSVDDIGEIRKKLDIEAKAFGLALDRCAHLSQRLGLSFNRNEQSIKELEALVNVSVNAPQDLMDYRTPGYMQPKCADLIEALEHFFVEDREFITKFSNIFYLDALPKVSEIKDALIVLRQKDGFFANFDAEWRRAKTLHVKLSKEKRNLSSRQRAEELGQLATWLEARIDFENNSEYQECFGPLFKGLSTDVKRINELKNWYVNSKRILLERHGLIDKVNLNNIPNERVAELAARSIDIKNDTDKLLSGSLLVEKLLPSALSRFNSSKGKNWDSAIQCLETISNELAEIYSFFFPLVRSSYLLKSALNALETKLELKTADEHLLNLSNVRDSLASTAGSELSQMIDLENARLDDSLLKFRKLLDQIVHASTQAFYFCGQDVSFINAEQLAISKRDFDILCRGITNLNFEKSSSWADVVKLAREVCSASFVVLDFIQQGLREDCSVADFFESCTSKFSADKLINHLYEIPEIELLLGDYFQGIHTDINCLERNYKWGSIVSELELPLLVRSKLLSIDANVALKKGAQLFEAMDNGCVDSKTFISELARFGTFDWDQWQSQFRSVAGDDRPSETYKRLSIASQRNESVLQLAKYIAVKNEAIKIGLSDLVKNLESGQILPEYLARAFDLVAFQSIGRSIFQKLPELFAFNAKAHDRSRGEFQALDSEIIKLSGLDFCHQISGRAQVPDGTRGAKVGDYTEMQLLRREISKKSRHIPIRQLLKRAGNALLELKPVFMMGPLSVAQYIEFGALEFDLVVMDEASQLRPEDAIGAVARGSQLIVVGDPKQLPPTNFFDRLVDSGDEDEDDAPAVITGVESILDICQQLFTPVRSLRWHYRSQHESLIAFSNHHFYRNLVVFPSPYANARGLGVKYRYIKDGVYKDRQNRIEAERVVDAVLEHFLTCQLESLGVVTLNQTQRELIEELLEKKLKLFPEGQRFLDHWNSDGWPFFIKNLENVQGDERDVIFISTTFGKTAGTDKVRQNFGPISRPDGWRRLNVLFTRAKRRIELFTSMSPDDVIVDERTPLGTKALHDYLDFAKRKVLVSTDENQRDPDSDFEVAVATVIQSMGYIVKPQLGVAGFFIDLVVRNPNKPGEYLAAIECDGATYHSGASVRDRDRIRQEILESLGWKDRIYRIWSTDWFYNPRESVAKLKNFLEMRLAKSIEESTHDGLFDQEEDDSFVLLQGANTVDQARLLVDENTNNLILEEGDNSDDIDFANDAFVEVGDRVTYVLLDDPDERHTVLISDSESNAKHGIINEHTPVAQSLLGLGIGDVGLLVVPQLATRRLKVIKIE